MTAVPIAIVGEGCVLPGAPDPGALWHAVRDGRDLTSTVPEGAWAVPERFAPRGAGALPYRGGFVDPDLALDPTGYAVAADVVRAADRSTRWLLDAGRQAVRASGRDRLPGRRVAVHLANLSYPTRAMVELDYALRVAPWLEGAPAPEPSPAVLGNAFSSGRPAYLLAEALGIEGPAVALDAACASSLYALRFGCDALAAGRVDAVLVAAVNGCENMFLHKGFEAIGALSATGRSRPFSRAADGLVPAEGAAALVLMRLDDARREGVPVRAVILGAGLSNDGRRRGLLSPDSGAQVRAITAAHADAGVTPSDIGLIECHATGTPTGDAVEITGLNRVFADHPDLPVGSVKSNLGHSITVAGLVGVLKLTAALREGLRPATLHADDPIATFADGPLRPLDRAEPWPDTAAPIAGLSTFGFGGNNAHLVLAAPDAVGRHPSPRPAPAALDPVVICGVGVVLGALRGLDALTDPVARAAAGGLRTDEVHLPIAGLRFPPRDLENCLPQQTLAMEVAGLALDGLVLPARERRGTVVGMGCDPDAGRQGLLWRAAHAADGTEPDADGRVAALDAAIGGLRGVDGTLGPMPNLPANRLNVQHDMAGLGLTVAAEELSGLAAVDLAAALLRRGDLDLVLAGAVDACRAPLHEHALDALAPGHPPLADGACLVALMRRSTAEWLGNPVLATLDIDPPARAGRGGAGAIHTPPLPTGVQARPHAASGIIDLALALAHALGGVAAVPGDPATPVPWAGAARRLDVTSFSGWSQTVHLDVPARAPAAGLLPDAPWLAAFAAADPTALANAVAIRRRGSTASDDTTSGVAGHPTIGGPEPTDTASARRASAAERPAGTTNTGNTAYGDAGSRGSASGAGRMAIGRTGSSDAVSGGPVSGGPVSGGPVSGGQVSGGPGFGVLAGGSGEAGVRLAVVAPTAELLDARLDAAGRALREGRPPAGPGLFHGAGREAGELAFAFPGLAAPDPTRSRRVFLAFPEVLDLWRRAQGALVEPADGFERLLAGPAPTRSADRERLTTALSLLGAGVLTDGLGLDPDACFGLSLGEATALVATGVWPLVVDAGGRAVFESFHDLLGGVGSGDRVEMDVFAPVADVRAVVESVEAAVLGLVTADHHCVVHGPAAACDRVAAALPGVRVARRPAPLAVHGPDAGLRDAMIAALAGRRAGPLPRARLYHGAGASAAGPDDLAARYSDAVLAPLDLRPLVRRVHADGARLFVDVGPGATLAPAIRATLDAPDVVVVALDRPGPDPLLGLAEAAARLFAAGAPVQLTALAARLARLRTAAPASAQAEGVLRLTTHLAQVRPLAAVVPGPPNRPRPTDPQPPVHESHLHGVRVHESHLHEPGVHEGHLHATRGQQSHLHEPGVHESHLDEPGHPDAASEPAAVMPRPPALVRWSAPGRVASREEPDPVPRVLPPAPDLTAERPPTASRVRPPAPARRAPEPLVGRPPTGPAFTRADLETLATGRVSDVFGPRFTGQDGHLRQCRLPRPPLLLVDRVLGVDGEPGSMGRGTVWTETDVVEDAWYLIGRRMPLGLVIEAGQADLLLISWLGCDAANRGERVYRLLGCEVTFHDGPLPAVGDTLSFQIHVDGHAAIGDTRLFFFSYDSRVGDRLVSSVRAGQAGFFSDAELAASDGVLWEPADQVPRPGARVDPTPLVSGKRAFDDADIAAFAAGDAYACFGPGFEMAAGHTSTPRIGTGRMRLIDRVTDFDPRGGPLGRGYLRAEADVPTDAWFYDGHFQHDPCMPGTLMAEAAAQALAVAMAALGLTVDRDGWSFRPVDGEPFRFTCRGQIVPDRPHRVSYEVFVEEIHTGERPVVYAALLARCDGFKVFLCERIGLRLAPEWPLPPSGPKRIVSPTGDVPGDADALAACALGPPGDAFGSMYAAMERVPRLPGPPYHFVSRVLSVDCPPGHPTPGGRVHTAYDVPPDAWYFADGGTGVLPFSVLTEVLLQPCGWLASYMGFALGADVRFRNLDGTGLRVHREVGPDAGTLTVEVTFLRHATAGATTIVFYELVCRAGEQLVATLTTDFGFFPPHALTQQKGLPVTDAMRAALRLTPPAADVHGLPTGRLAVLDEVVGHADGRAVGRQRVDPSAWYFRAHFFQDPVQPGSLGLEAVLSLLKAAARLAGFDGPRFEGPALGEDVAWRYRGQVVPTNDVVTTEVEILAVEDEPDGVRLVRGRGALWVDGLKIYAVDAVALRLHPAGPAPRPATPLARLDPAAAPWLRDHRPTHTIPTYPLMAMAGLMLGDGSAIERVEMRGWLRLDGAPVLVDLADRAGLRVAHRPGDERPLATGRPVETPPGPRPEPWPEPDGTPEPDPYGRFGLFHDGAFRVARALRVTDAAAVHTVDMADALTRADGDRAILLDALVHGFPHGAPTRWYPDATGHLAVPYRVDRLDLHEPLPTHGVLRVVTRRGPRLSPRTVGFAVQARLDGRVVLSADVVEALVPHPHAGLAPVHRRAFSRGRWPVDGALLGRPVPGGWRVDRATVAALDVLPGTVAVVYGVPAAWAEGDRLVEAVAMKELLAGAWGVHPARVLLDETAVPRAGLLCTWDGEGVTVVGPS